MNVDPSLFKQALGQFASGITVVTTRDAGGSLRGLTVSAFCSLSLDPPLVLVCIDDRAESNGAFEESGVFGVSVLADGQEEIARRFAQQADKFGMADLETGRLGVALVKGALAQIECRLHAAHDGGDHTIYVGEVVRLAVRPGRPLLYHGGAYGRLEGASRTSGSDRV